MRKFALSLLLALSYGAASAASYTSFVTNAPVATAPAATDALGLVQGGLTKHLSISTLTSYLQSNLPIISMLGYTPCSTAGCTMTGPLVAPLQALGATAALDLGTREQQLGYLVTDFGAKCDGTTIDTVAIQTAMNAAASLGAWLNIAPRGKVCVSGELGYKGGARLVVDGMLQGDGGNHSLLSNFSSLPGNGGSPVETDVIIAGDGIIDDGRTTRGSPGPTACVDYYGAVQGFTLRGVTLQNCGNFPFNLVGGPTNQNATVGYGAAHVYVSYVKVLGTGNNNASEFANGCNDCWVDHTRFDNTTGDFQLAFYGSNFNSGVTNSYFNGNGNIGTLGIGVLSDAGAQGPSSNILIQGNKITGENDTAIFVQGTSSQVTTTAAAATSASTTLTVASGTGIQAGEFVNGTSTTVTSAYVSGSTTVPLSAAATFTNGQSLNFSTGQLYKHKNIQIIANEGYGNNLSHAANRGGEVIIDASNVQSIGNTFHDDAPGSGVSSCIYLYQTGPVSLASDGYTSTSDTCYNEGANGGTGLGAVLGSGILTPAFYNFRAYNLMQAFNGTCAADCTIIGSKIDAATVASPFGGLTISGSATIALNGPTMGNYIQGDLVVPGNSTNGGIGIFNGGLRATLPSACTGLTTGTIYDNGDHVARVCP